MSRTRPYTPLINVVDVFATICEITDGKLPDSKEIAPDSFSFLPCLNQSKRAHQRTSMVTADARGMHAIRMGAWKYINNVTHQAWSEGKQGTFKNVEPQLYNLVDDLSESTNVIDEEPDIAKKTGKGTQPDQKCSVNQVGYTSARPS